METFEQVHEQYEAMIHAVMRKAGIYKNFDHYRQSASIALWQAWTNYNPEQGHFAPYAYRYMLTTLYKEMQKDNRYSERFVVYEKDKMGDLAQFYQTKHHIHNDFPHLDHILDKLTAAERALLVDLYVHEYSYEELAKRDNVSVDALKKRRNRLLKRVREGMK